MSENDKSGIYSLGGFAYQIKVFAAQLVRLHKGDQLEFETIDDVALNIQPTEIDKYCDQTVSYCSVGPCYEAIQVKKTNVTKAVAEGVLKNWINIRLDTKGIEKYVLFTDRSNTKEEIFQTIDCKKIFEDIEKSNLNKRSIDGKLKKHKFTYSVFEQIFKDVISKSKIVKFEDIDKEIFNLFEEFLIKAAVTEATYNQRLKQLMMRITVELLECISKGNPYVINYEKLSEMKNSVIVEITDKEWDISYSNFRKMNKVNIQDLAILKSREYRQLKECDGLENSDIVRHLEYGEYYVDCRRSYYECGKKSLVEDLEYTTFENFCDAKLELTNKDTPINRLRKTKEKSNERANNEQIKYGVCINLTNENTDEELKISWKDE